jgi:two-component system, OmpR family, alkaline phosphatase synthesis response regulator PhoP
MGQRILLVEDEPGLVLTLTDRLEAEGYSVESRQDGEAGLSAALSGAFDLIILDLMLPRKSGLDVCRGLRQKGASIPILMLTARSQVVDKVVGLRLGADDYLTKPFDTMELIARVEALLRRVPAAVAHSGERYRLGSIEVDFRRAEVVKAGKPVVLSAREFQLLHYLIDHRGDTLSREELLTEVWKYDSMPSTRTVDVHVAWLRQKLEDNPKFPQLILTIRGLGYKFTG